MDRTRSQGSGAASAVSPGSRAFKISFVSEVDVKMDSATFLMSLRNSLVVHKEEEEVGSREEDSDSR